MGCKNCKVVDIIKRKIEKFDKGIEDQEHVVKCMEEEKREIKDEVEMHFEDEIRRERRRLMELKYAKKILVDTLNEAKNGCSN